MSLGAFEIYLKEQGFKIVRGLPENKDFSTMVPNGISRVWNKGDVNIEYGLNEKGKPPTLCYPRPLPKSRHIGDDEMNDILLNNDCETVFKSLFDSSVELVRTK